MFIMNRDGKGAAVANSRLKVYNSTPVYLRLNLPFLEGNNGNQFVFNY